MWNLYLTIHFFDLSFLLRQHVSEKYVSEKNIYFTKWKLRLQYFQISQITALEPMC